MKKLLILPILSLAFAAASVAAESAAPAPKSAAPLEWSNLEPARRLAGQHVTPGFLLGKVVLVDCRDFGAPNSNGKLVSMERLWNSYRSKPFILLGSHRGAANAEAAKARLEEAEVTFPVYDDAGVALKADKHEPGAELLYIVAADGKVRGVYRDEHTATIGLTTWLGNAESPSSPKLMKSLLEFEAANLPGRAYSRLQRYRKENAYEAADFDEMWKKLSNDETAIKIAKLETLAAQARDPAYGKKLSLAKIDKVIAYYTPFKKDARPEIVQETKNCLAELIWAKAALEAEKEEKEGEE